jgi:hypothetical protein
MSTCTCPEFQVKLTISPEVLVATARRAIAEAGGKLEGDTQKGSFSVPTPFGAVAGIYRIADGHIYITIQQRPFLLPCFLIEELVRRLMRDLPVLHLAEAEGAACDEFVFDFKGSAEALVAAAKKAVLENGGKFEGDTSKGRFDVVGVMGTYKIAGQKFYVLIQSKPWYIPCALIKELIASKIPQS